MGLGLRGTTSENSWTEHIKTFQTWITGRPYEAKITSQSDYVNVTLPILPGQARQVEPILAGELEDIARFWLEVVKEHKKLRAEK